jgi:hypothetical protein
MDQQKPLNIEVVTHVAGSMDHCGQCQVVFNSVGIGGQIHREDVASYPEDFLKDWERLSAWVYSLAETYPGKLIIRITDAQSMNGLWKAISRGVRKYPTFIIEGEDQYQGWDNEALKALIHKHLASAAHN